MSDMRREFIDILQLIGEKPNAGSSQNTTRNYSERLSREIALWIGALLRERFPKMTILPPEGKVNTIYGVGSRGKSLDVGMVDERGYLLVDISIKTFNFKDHRTHNYRKNFTGRFYELLGEELDLRRSYRHAILAAFIFLPADSFTDSKPSSFALAAKQFSKILKQSGDPESFGFDFVYVATHTPAGDVTMFDSRNRPPMIGLPKAEHALSIVQVLDQISERLDQRRSAITGDNLPTYNSFEFD